MKNQNYPLYKPPVISSISDMLEKKALKSPEGSAFRFRKGRDHIEEKTYGDVCLEVRKTASLVEQQYGRGSHIAIIGENSYEWMIAFFSVLCSGNVAVPIDKELPAAEVAWMIDHADVTAAFVSKTYSDVVENIDGLSVMTLKELQKAGEEGDSDYQLYHPQDDELASIFFTSGTTGKPKGVMLSHGNLAYETVGPARLFHPEGFTTLSVLPYHHEFGLNVAVLMAYNYGVSIFLNKSLKRVKEDLMIAKPVILMLVPMFTEVFYKQIMDGIKKSGREKKVRQGIRLSNLLLKFGIDKRRTFFSEIIDEFGGELKYIISGGAHLDTFYVKAFRDFGIEVLNGYGASELSPCVAINRNYYKRDGSVGPAIPGMDVRTTPDGEVQFKGPATMMGYYKNPEATEEVIQDGWYSTGDLGYVDKDGFIFLTGRKKNLIILSNGENISPEELENDYSIDPGVCEVLVYAQNEMLVAAIYPEEEYRGNTAYFEELTEKINQDRPMYKKISRVVLRDEEFIKNTSQKIVRYKNIPD